LIFAEDAPAPSGHGRLDLKLAEDRDQGMGTTNVA
jgi:hypothetical protein